MSLAAAALDLQPLRPHGGEMVPRATKVTSAPAFASAAPNPPPTPPAPTTAIRIVILRSLAKISPSPDILNPLQREICFGMSSVGPKGFSLSDRLVTRPTRCLLSKTVNENEPHHGLAKINKSAIPSIHVGKGIQS